MPPMMTQRPKKLIATLSGSIQKTPPVWLMRQAGRYLPEYRKTRAEAGDFLDLVYNPTLATEVTLQPIRRYGFDAAILFSDILVVPHALGQDLHFEENAGPVLGELPSLQTFKESVFHGKLGPVYEGVSSIRRQLDQEGFTDTTLIGFSGAPWTLACYMVDKKGSKEFISTRVMALQKPQEFMALIDLLTEAVTAYLGAQIQAGAEVLQIFDSWAGVLPPDQFRQWVIEPTQKIVAALKEKYPSIPVIGFPKGAGVLAAEYATKTRVSALGVDHTLPVEWADQTLDAKLPLQGNLDPCVLQAGGEHLERETHKILETFRNRPHIFNLGHGIDKGTPPDHVAQLMRLIREQA